MRGRQRVFSYTPAPSSPPPSVHTQPAPIPAHQDPYHSPEQDVWYNGRTYINRSPSLQIPLSPLCSLSFSEKIFWPCHLLCRILVPRPENEPVTPAVEAGGLLHWTTGEVPGFPLDVEHPMGLDKFTVTSVCVCVLLSRVCLFMNPVDCSCKPTENPRDSPSRNTGVDCHLLLQEIFLTQGFSPGLPHCGQV